MAPLPGEKRKPVVHCTRTGKIVFDTKALPGALEDAKAAAAQICKLGAHVAGQVGQDVNVLGGRFQRYVQDKLEKAKADLDPKPPTQPGGSTGGQ